jgi:hypothetical protein
VQPQIACRGVGAPCREGSNWAPWPVMTDFDKNCISLECAELFLQWSPSRFLDHEKTICDVSKRELCSLSSSSFFLSPFFLVLVHREQGDRKEWHHCVLL